jgi:hypothetical protein
MILLINFVSRKNLRVFAVDFRLACTGNKKHVYGTSVCGSRFNFQDDPYGKIAEIRFRFVTFLDFAIIIRKDCGKISDMVKRLV